ncbi:SGNH/GDSL hydrolase family protein [Vagococcus sp. BWB3-3]|uniref:SGNH/GDSL hydrolase family protein n=1 Tax=Vagococcus allomyrinae TaxID=2794353 RepID=A0A940P9I4_9ENTE|nr:SGNH/GDSL hydrolase family protein [Vagococcus allomyrinae]MBP1039978.1 SGNH/GDSL hydrolase family protein [Vagococcus allomyrinae]
MSLEKVIIVIIVMRLLDVIILFFSRKLKKRGALVRGVLLTLVTVVAMTVLVMDMRPLTNGEAQGATKVVESLTGEGQKVVNEQLEAVELAKRPYLEGKKVAVIGDSITELDGKTVKNVGSIIGYQEVFRQQGATVVTYGYSGATYALYDKKISAGEHRSIYDMIVKAKVDFKDVDLVTLFGGTNDVGGGYPLGTVTDKTAATTLGGLRGIIDYIKSNNPKCEIVVFTPIQRTDRDNLQEKMDAMALGIMEVAKSYELATDNLMENSGITNESGNQAKYTYDKLHPNSEGMALVGQRMAEVIEETME